MERFSCVHPFSHGIHSVERQGYYVIYLIEVKVCPAIGGASVHNRKKITKDNGRVL